MRVLVLTRSFLPTVGGLIRVAQIARLLSRRGIQMVVVTRTPGESQEAPYQVRRRLPPRDVLREVLAADAIYLPNLSLREFWPLALVRKPWVVSHHSWYTRTDGSITIADLLKRTVTRRASLSMAVSRELADLGPETMIAPTPYRDDVFYPRPEIQRAGDLVFAGRLVSDKGVDLLINAVSRLSRRDLRCRLTIVGDGPERPLLERNVDRFGIRDLVAFRGVLEGEALARELAAHEVMVVPSRYREPFGIVALEGMACGCVVIGSEGGGLKDAIGPGGLLFPNGSIDALAARIRELLTDATLRRRLRTAAVAHLLQFRGAAVADSYTAIFRRLVRDRG